MIIKMYRSSVACRPTPTRRRLCWWQVVSRPYLIPHMNSIRRRQWRRHITISTRAANNNSLRRASTVRHIDRRRCLHRIAGADIERRKSCQRRLPSMPSRHGTPQVLVAEKICPRELVIYGQVKGVKTRFEGVGTARRCGRPCKISKAMVSELRGKIWALGFGVVGRAAHGAETNVFGWFWWPYF